MPNTVQNITLAPKSNLFGLEVVGLYTLPAYKQMLSTSTMLKQMFMHNLHTSFTTAFIWSTRRCVSIFMPSFRSITSRLIYQTKPVLL